MHGCITVSLKRVHKNSCFFRNSERIIWVNVQETKHEYLQMPWWNKYTFSVQETSEYFGFSDKKIRKLIDENEDADFILWNGSRPRIKRKLFEQFVDEKLTAI